MTGKNPIAQAASAAYRYGFARGTDALFVTFVLAASIFAGFVTHAWMTKPQTVVATGPQCALDAGWKCQIANGVNVALCRLPSPTAETLPPAKP
jgi:hypothetical protein